MDNLLTGQIYKNPAMVWSFYWTTDVSIGYYLSHAPVFAQKNGEKGNRIRKIA